MLSQLCAVLCGQVGRCNIEDGLASALSLFAHAVCGSRICNQNRGSKFRIGVQLQIIFDQVIVLAVPSGLSAADYEAAVGDAAVVFLHFLFADEMYDRVIFIEIVSAWS